jgi:endonuclease/exonuclease/phosphatase family metal-dependent hydrolase
MLSKFESMFRRFRRVISRSEWAIRLLRLRVSDGTATRPGLLMIQIDGLGRRKLQAALGTGRMPFLRRLLREERYVVHPQYSGLPASTPAFQAELFYGVKGAVPAFSFLDKTCGCIFKMYEPKSAAEVEQRLAAEGGPPLLEGGSAYVDIFTGGAAESHFCASSFGWGQIIRAVRPIALPLLLLLRLDIVARVAVLLVVEAGLAVIDFARGALAGKGLVDELLFVPTRVAICILLRELVVFGAQIDLARGLPIVHVNLIGYDEQAHRRGPSSRFAQWTLRGIDASVARMWRTAMRSARRTYDVWIYSDHGQQDTFPYAVEHGRTVQEAVREVLARVDANGSTRGEDEQGVQTKRAALLGGVFSWLVFWHKPQQEEPDHQLTVTAMGSLGHVYPPRPLTEQERRRVAEELVRDAKIPLVLVPTAPGRATAWTARGTFELPGDTGRLLGENHPYLADVAKDLIDICHHPDAGAMVISGYRPDGRHQSFPQEFGSHTGPGIDETDAFSLLPADAPLPTDRPRPYLRPWDLREGVHRLLGKTVAEITPQPRRAAELPITYRVLTYNIHGCVGMDGKVSPERIARVIAHHSPDVVALQELDIGRDRSGGIDQPRRLAELLGMRGEFQPAMQLSEGQYGNAILSRHPIIVRAAGPLPRMRDRWHFQPRVAQWITVDLGGVPLHVINCHLSLWPRERLLQSQALVGPEWLGHSSCVGPVVVCGDFNALPDSPVCRGLSRYLKDAQRILDNHEPLRTWPGRYLMSRIDHVFVGPQVEVVSVEVPTTELEKVASDHLPLIVDIKLRVTDPSAPGALQPVIPPASAGRSR